MTKVGIGYIIGSLSIFVSSCGVYSFTGTSISDDVKTVQIENFENYAPVVNPSLSQDLYIKLQDKFVELTSLSSTEEEGDLLYEGEITDYRVVPASIEANDQAANNKLTITIKIRFYNNKDEKQNKEQSFTAFDFFPANTTLDPSLEEELVDVILDQIVENIFNATLSNW